MAPNPSAALRVVLAALLAAGPLRPAVAFAEPAASPGREFNVLQVGDVVPVYNGILLRARDLAGLRNGQEKEVEAVVPTKMDRQGTLTWHTYKLIGKTEKVKVKLVYEYRSSQPGRWQLFRGGKWVAGRDGKTATFEGCIPNGGRRCFNGITGVARNFILETTPGGTPAPTPAPTPTPTPRPTPTPTPTPGTDFAGPFPWRGAPINDTATGVEHRKCKKAECSCTGDSCKGKRVDLYAVTKAEKSTDTLKLTMTLDADYYLTHAGGKWNLCWVSGTRASVPVPYLAGFADAKFLPDATYWVKASTAAGDFKGAKKAEFSWTGSAPAKPRDTSPECAYGDPAAPPETPPDPVAGKLKDLLGDDKGALALARLAQKVWTGSPTFAEALEAALKDPDRAKGRAEFLEKAKQQALADIAKSAGVLKADPPLKTDFKEAYCKPAGAPPPAAVERSSTNLQEAGRMAADPGRADGRGTAPVVAAPGSPYAALCSLLEDSQPSPRPPGDGTTPPPDPGGRPAVTADAAQPSTAEADAKKKKDLQRMVIGGMGGAIVLGVFGFIFGGPIGALAMGALGFGIMAGVTYLNNNPIDK